jgi:hypothetical protein
MCINKFIKYGIKEYKYILLIYIMDIPFVPFFIMCLVYLLFSIFSLLTTSINSSYKNSCDCCYDVWVNLLSDSVLKLVCSFIFLLFGYTGFRRFSNKSYSTDINLFMIILLSLPTDIFSSSIENRCLPQHKDNCNILWHMSSLNMHIMYFIKIPVMIICILSRIINKWKCNKYKFYYLLDKSNSIPPFSSIDRNIGIDSIISSDNNGEIEICKV